MNELPDITQFLRSVPGFDNLIDAQLLAAAKSIKIAYYRRGEDILTIGNENHYLHIVRSGAIELRDDDDNIMARLAESDCFGFPSLMNGTPARNHSVAIEDSLVYHVAGETFAKIRRENVQFDTWFIRALTDRLMLQPPAPSFRGVAGALVSTLVGRPPVSFEAGTTIQDVAAKMVEERVSAMLITEAGQVSGIVTDRDIRARVVATGLGPETSVTDVMTREPITLDGDALAYEAALLMMQNHIHHLPITSGGKLLGMVSRSDFMRLETEHPLYLVSDIGRQTTADRGRQGV